MTGKQQLDRERAEALRADPHRSWEEIAVDLARHQHYAPDGTYLRDPRDDMPIVYNAARAYRPHDNRPDTAASGDSPTRSECVVCSGRMTPIIDIAELSEGFTFINFNLYPMVLPAPTGTPSETGAANRIVGLHLLQWTSSVHGTDWDNLPSEDRLTAISRLAALERQLSEGHPYITIIKNYGHLVGGSLVHGHQQIGATDTESLRARQNRLFCQREGHTVSAKIGADARNQGLVVKEFPTGTLSVHPWMRRPYEMVYTVTDDGPSRLHHLSTEQLQDLADALGLGIGIMMKIFPGIKREPAYNIVFNTGQSGNHSGIYVEFLPYTQETGGFEHSGLYICQGTPELCHSVINMHAASRHPK